MMSEKKRQTDVAIRRSRGVAANPRRWNDECRGISALRLCPEDSNDAESAILQGREKNATWTWQITFTAPCSLGHILVGYLSLHGQCTTGSRKRYFNGQLSKAESEASSGPLSVE